MNILITLPKELLEKIISGQKTFEIRHCFPKHMELCNDGFFVVEKGTDDIRCWCRIDGYMYTFIDHYSAKWLAYRAGVPAKWIEKYADGKKIYLWEISKVKVFENLKRKSLIVDRNPEQFAYCPLSYGESF